VTTRKLYTGTRAAEPGHIEVVASTGAVDRQQDRVRPAGIRLDNFRRNPIITWAHRYDQLPVGRATEVTATERDLRAKIQFAPDAFSQQVYQHYRGGFLNAVSIGFQPLGEPRRNEHGGLDYDAAELLEIACVPVPANAEALVVARDIAAAGFDVARNGPDHAAEGFDTLSLDQLREAAADRTFHVDPAQVAALVERRVDAALDIYMPLLGGSMPDGKAATKPLRGDEVVFEVGGEPVRLGWLADKIAHAFSAAWDRQIIRLTGRLPD
jgi:HK97 family phage prohead protease